MAEDKHHDFDENQKLNLLQDISLTLAKADSMAVAFKEVLGHICRFMGWPLGHVYVWSETAKALVSSRVWYMADASTITPFRLLSETTQFKKGEGTMGLVWESGGAIFILDVRDETVFVRQMPVEEGGIRAYFAFPIIIEGEVTAVLEFFSPVAAEPNQDIKGLINHVSTLLALAMQRQETLTNLEESKARLDEAQRTAHVGHWEWDIVNNEVSWSPELFRIYGLADQDFVGNYEEYLKRIHPDDLATVQKNVGAAYEKGEPFDYFHRIVRPDGVERVVHARGRPVFDGAGNVIKLNGTTQDMTEQKEAEVKLAQTIRQLSALMEMAQAVSATLELERIYELMLSSIRPLIGAEIVFLLLEEAGELEIVASDQDGGPDLIGFRVANDQGIAGSVYQSGQSEFLRGPDCLARLSSKITSQANYIPEAMLSVPLRWQEKVVGVLQATQRGGLEFEESDLRLLESAATWTAIAIGNARQYQQLQRRLVESEAILAISNAMTEVYNLDELLRLIARQIQDIIANTDWTTIHLLDPKTGQLELAASAGFEISPDDYLINSGEGIAGLVIAEGGVINVPDLQTDERRLPIDRRTQARSLLSAPVETQRERIGTLTVQCATPGIFTEDDERLLTIFGVQAGMAIENARLYRVQQIAREKAEKQKRRMQQMARRVVEAQEKERDRIARELHDESGQSLTSLKISLDLIRSLLPEEMTEVRQGLADVLALTDKTMTNLRLLSHNLRPPGLDAFGIDAALAGLCQDFANHTSLKVDYSGVELLDLAPLTALSLYRFAQEALTNAAKHGQASEIGVTLSQDSDMIRLVVSDNGQGFTPPNLVETIPVQGAGLLGMIERLEMVDGNLTIESDLGRGSVLTAVVPSDREEI